MNARRHDAGDTHLSVLVADDDHWTTKALRCALIADGDITVLTPVHSGEEAVGAYRAHRPDVVLMDIHMPHGMSGIEATSQIRQIDPHGTVVVLSTVSPGPGLARALEAGAVAAINKSCSESALRDTVRSAACGDDPAMLRYLARDIVIAGDSLPDSPPHGPELTACELQILTLICRGYGYEDIAEAQGITVWTAKTHTRHLREKLHAENLAQLIVRALQFRFYSV